MMQFEKDASFAVNQASEMEINTTTNKKNNTLSFQVKESSDDKPATVTISDLELYLSRDIPAGLYDLLLDTSMEQGSDMNSGFGSMGKGTGYLDTVLYGGVKGDDYVVEDVTE